MRTSIRFSGKVHFLASIRAKQRQWGRFTPHLRCVTPSPRAAPAATASEPSGSGEAESAANTAISPEQARWLNSLRAWAAWIPRRMGLRGPELDDALQAALTLAVCNWASFEPPPEQSDKLARRTWFATLVWKVSFQMCARRDRERKVQPANVESRLADRAIESHESRVLSRDMLRHLEHTTTDERWRVWTAYKVDGVSVEEIARQHGRPTPTIYNMLRLAQRDFTAALRRETSAATGPLVSRRRRKARR